MNTATQIIETLYKTGKITFEEAITLGLTQKDQPKNEVNHLMPFKKQYTIEQIVNDTIDGHEEDGEYIEGLDFDHITQHLIEKNWSMLCSTTQKIESVEDHPEMVRENAKYVATEALNILKEKIVKWENSEISEDELEITITTGAFKATAYVDEEYIELEIQFVPDNVYHSVPLEDFMFNNPQK